MIYPIRYYGDPILRRRASPVTRFDDDLAQLAANMFETMYAADGIGLAAPQIGVPLRVFVALEVPDRDEDDEDGEPAEPAARGGNEAPLAGQLGPDAPEPKTHGAGSYGPESLEADDDTPLTPAEKRRAWGVVREHVIVNPVLKQRSGGQLGRDGCLSLPGLTVDDVPRAMRVVMEYQDLNGAKRELDAHGYFAHVLQHEYDHLEGVLFFDHLPAARRDRFLDENRAQLAQWQRDAKARLKAPPERQQRTKVG